MRWSLHYCASHPSALRFGMSRAFLILIALAFVFAGCAPLNHRDRDFLQGRGLSGTLHGKMMHHEPLTLDDIIELSQKGVPGPFIVHYLQPTYFVYKLSSNDAARLRKAGVEEGVVRYLAATPGMFSPASEPLWYENDDYYRNYPRY